MKKNLFLFSLLFLMMGGLLFAQFSPQIRSLEAEASYNIFWNELDYTSRPTEEFSEYENDYLFGGLTNISKEATTVDSVDFEVATTPYWAGFYKAGDMPWSVFAGLFHVDASTIADDTSYTYANDPYSATESQRWVQEKTETEYDTRLFDQAQDQGQFLIDIGGGMITGLYMFLDLQDSSPLANNYTQTRTVNYDADGTATAKADVQTDFTVKTEETDLATDRTYNFGIPFYMATGDLEHSIRLGLGFNAVNGSSSSSVTNSAAEVTNRGTQTDTLANDVVDESLDTTIDLQYSLNMPALFGGEDNELYLYAQTGYVFHSQDYSEEINEKDYDLPGGGTKTLLEQRVDTTEETHSGAADFNINLWAGHSFMYELGDGVEFGFMPALGLGFDVTPGNSTTLEKAVITNKIDADANGSFTDPGDTFDVTTVEFTDTTAVNYGTGALSGRSSEFAISTIVSCPVSIQAQPENWFLGLTLGSRPLLSYSSTIENTYVPKAKITTDDKVTNTETVQESTGTESELREVSNSWTVEADYNMGVYFDINENVRFDVDVSGAVVSGIWDFQALKVQAIIALP